LTEKLDKLIGGTINLHRLGSYSIDPNQIKNLITKHPAKYELQKILNFHSQEVACISPLQDGKMMSGSLDTTIKIWDPISYSLINTIDGHTHMVTIVIELKNGNLASSSIDKTVNIWDRHTGEILNTLEGFEDDIVDM
jgi:WD40 repeat protein